MGGGRKAAALRPVPGFSLTTRELGQRFRMVRRFLGECQRRILHGTRLGVAMQVEVPFDFLTFFSQEKSEKQRRAE